MVAPNMNGASVAFGEMAGRVLAALQARRVQGERVAPFVVVTSAVAGEGKSFVAEGLALHLAALSARQIMLVDANPARPAATRRFNAAGHPGLMDLLRGEGERSTEAPKPLPTDLDNLAVLGIGQKPETAVLFRDGALARLLAWAAQRCELLILDAGPLSEPGAAVLAEGAMQGVLVVDSQRTARSTVAGALARSGRGAQAWGVVLNRRPRKGLGLLDQT
jgi:Mrp family chromosome partitioning ATPase